MPDDIPAAQRRLRARGLETMERLVQAGLEVFATIGYNDARVDDVVARSGDSHGTFYLYFGNKDDLLLTLAFRCADEMVDLARELPVIDTGPAGVGQLRTWLDRFLTIHERYVGVIRAWMESHVADERLADFGRTVLGDFAVALMARLAEVDREPDIPVELRATALLALLERCSYIVATEGKLARPRLLDTLAPMLHRGFFQPSGRPPLRPLVARAPR